MTIRQFIFCDICNPQGLRNIEQRRGISRDNRDGRRINDGRAWIESDVSEAVKEFGWSISEDGRHVCPECKESLRA